MASNTGVISDEARDLRERLLLSSSARMRSIDDIVAQRNGCGRVDRA